MHNELIRMHERVEELITDALVYTREMGDIASELYGEAVNVSINGGGDIMYTRDSDGEELDISDITGRPRIYTNHY